MKIDVIIKEVALKTGHPEEVVKLYLKAYIESQRRSVSVYEPIKVHGKVSFNLHNYILKYKMEGKNLPMPEGIMDTLNEDRSAYNYRRKEGTFVKVGDTIGVVIKQIGDDSIQYMEICHLEPYSFGKYERYKLIFDTKDIRVLGRGEYPRTGSVKGWWKKMSYKIDPPTTADSLIRKIRQAWRG